MKRDNNRLLVELDRTIRDVNRAIINPTISELSLADLQPVLQMVAHARAAYLRELFDLAEVAGDAPLGPEQVRKLKALRLSYDELLAAAQALEVAVERGYLDVTAHEAVPA